MLANSRRAIKPVAPARRRLSRSGRIYSLQAGSCVRNPSKSLKDPEDREDERDWKASH